VRGLSAANPPCPWLPEVAAPLDYSVTRRHGKDRGPAFYQDSLAYAQSHWRSAKPAQALLQLNKAWMTDNAPPVCLLEHDPPPYRALVWILRHAADGTHGFLGNPVRHFQHLATRMAGPNPEPRIWRAWTCFHLARRTLRTADSPPDGAQLARSGLWVPGWQSALNHLTSTGWPGEAAEAIRAMDDACEPMP
jgi:hypothetical protein